MIAFNNKSGASRLQRGSKAQSSIGVSMAVWFKRAIGAGIFLALVIGAVAGLRAVERSPVGGVELFGYSGTEDSSRGATEEEIYLLMDEYLEQGFWEIDLVALQSVLESHRWIRRAAVLRQWPNILRVQIDEHLPVARWNGTHVLASSAELIPVSSIAEFSELPRFTTPGMFSHDRTDIKLMVDEYNKLQKMLSPYYLAIHELGSSLGSDIWLVLQDGTRIELGEKSHLERLTRLIGLVQGGIIDDWSSIAIADLRYAYGVSISWRDSVREIQGGDQPQALRNSAVQGKQKMRVGMAVVNKHGLDVVANNVRVRPMQTMGVQHV